MSNSYIASKPRYEILDGLRGVAAVIVVLFHMFECYSPGTLEQIINHGYLAVDFFSPCQDLSFPMPTTTDGTR